MWSGRRFAKMVQVRHFKALKDRHYQLRRCIAYGPLCDAASDTSQEQSRGLLFNAYVADLNQQFEFVLQNWVNSPTFGGCGRDPILGDIQEALTIHQANGNTVTFNWKRFVNTCGSLYLFAPSRTVLQSLAHSGNL